MPITIIITTTITTSAITIHPWHCTKLNRKTTANLSRSGLPGANEERATHRGPQQAGVWTLQPLPRVWTVQERQQVRRCDLCDTHTRKNTRT